MGRIRLSALKLTGFKSFADPVELEFPGPVTAVVGPNGSGKSNIVDAILWVLGEQSPSLLRLKQMGDLVFSGSGSRPPAGAAEVSLTLSADDGRWEETGGILTLSRRVSRDGPSAYRINGRTVRLKDVVDELAGIGLATRSYAIIEQGRIGQVLSARPTDRRALIEEAAGIVRYKVRRHEAELKLQQTRQNLLRLEDVVGEVDRSLRQVKRQARQAERYRKLEAELNGALARLRAHEVRELRRRTAELQRERARAENEVAAAASALGGADADLAAARKELEARRAEMEKAREEVAALLASCERAEAFLERSSDLLEELHQARRRALAEEGTVGERRRRLEEELESASARLEELESALASARTEATARSEAASEARKARDAGEKALAEARQAMLQAISELTATRNRLVDLEREGDRIVYATAQLEKERERLTARREEALDRLANARSEAEDAARRVAELEEGRSELLRRREALAVELAEAGRETERLGHELWEARHALNGLERELARRTGPAERLEALLSGTRVSGQVSDFLDPDPEVAALLDRAWRTWLDLPVVDAGELGRLDRAGLARIEERLLVAVRGGVEAAVPSPGAPEGLEPLTDRAGIPDGEASWLSRVLPPVFLAPTVEAALAGADAVPWAVVVTADGTVVRGRAVELPTGGAELQGVLGLREERARLRRELEEGAARLETLSGRKAELARRHEELSAEAETRAAELVEAEQARASLAAVEEAAAAEAARLERELDAVIEELGRNRELASARSAQREELQCALAQLESRNETLEADVERLAGSLESLRARAAEAAREADRAAAEVRLTSERVQTARSEVERLRTELERLEVRGRELGKAAEDAAGRITATEAEIVATRNRLAEEQGLLTAAREGERRAAEAVEAVAARAERLEREVRTRREEYDRRREALHALQMEETRLEGELQALGEAVAGELRIGLEELLATVDGEELVPEAVAELESVVASIRQRLERIGTVNLLALEQLEELEERSRFLHEQREDLVRSLRSLEATIREIDQTCTERFVETFRKVGEVFAETFAYLFGGGTARLELVDEENPLESGIDIVARPPGKRVQSVQLLSGGEKALAALALLVALFRIKPSPFCILDEVDAPLDDANVERLADLVREMTEHTQFLLVTHNRRTMARADILYGVTMEEPGVSKIVSVRLEDMT